MSSNLSRFVPEGVSWIRAAVSAIPAVGGALDHLLFDKADAIRMKNLEAAIAAVSSQINSMGENAIDKSWFETEEALVAFKVMSDKVAYESDARKVEAMGRIVAACGTTAHSKDVRKLSIVEHLSRLSAVQIELLATMAKVLPTQKQIRTGDLVQTVTAIWISDVTSALKAGPAFWTGDLLLIQELEILESLNVIRRIQVMGGAEAAYSMTELGKSAASYVKTARF